RQECALRGRFAGRYVQSSLLRGSIVALETTFMDFDRMKQISEGFQDAADVLKKVSQALEAAMTVLKMTAFIGFVGTAAVERFISVIKPRIDELAKQFVETSDDINGAMEAFRA